MIPIIAENVVPTAQVGVIMGFVAVARMIANVRLASPFVTGVMDCVNSVHGITCLNVSFCIEDVGTVV